MPGCWACWSVTGATVGFRHELARLAAAEQIPDYRRRELHACALDALSDPPIAPEMLGALAFHAGEAGDADAVIRYGPDAAARAAGLRANREAAELYDLVLRHADPGAGRAEGGVVGTARIQSLHVRSSQRRHRIFTGRDRAASPARAPTPGGR